MAGQAGKRVGPARIVGLAAALAVAVPLLAPTGAHAEKANVGGGAIHGTVEFDSPGLESACVNGVGFDVNGFAPSFVYNTVITGFAGAFRLTGRGFSECQPGSQVLRSGTLDLTASGTGPTGSRIECASLSGQFERIGTAVTVNVNGDCIVNSYGLGTNTFIAALQFTPLDFTVEDANPEPPNPPALNVSPNVVIRTAYFDGNFIMFPKVD